jgi:hypothetical protein
MRDRDREKRFDHMFDYSIGPRGVEPKLKLKLSSLPELLGDDFSLVDAIHRIILGPSVSSPIQNTMFCKMLDRIGKPELKDRILSSKIPFRSL